MTDTKELLAQAGAALDAERLAASFAAAVLRASLDSANAEIADLRAQIEALKPDPWAKVDKTGKTDVTDAVQALYEQGEPIPAGRFLIDPERSVNLRTGVNLVMQADTFLIAKPNGADPTAVLKAEGVRNVTITGGQVIGDRGEHVRSPGKQDEHGHGIHIKGCDNVAINGTTFSYCWGDGIDIGPSRTGGKIVASTNITLNGVVCDENRRNGLTIGNAVGVKVLDSTFSNTGRDPDGDGPMDAGTSPFCGIDIEPDAVGDGIAADIVIDNCHVFGNRWGINCRARVRNVTVSNNIIEKQVSVGFYALAVDGLSLTTNKVRDNGGTGMQISPSTTGAKIEGNEFARNKKALDRAKPITQAGYINAPKDLLVADQKGNTPGVNTYA